MLSLYQTHHSLGCNISPPHHTSAEFSNFIDEFTSYLEEVIVSNGHLVMLGDFNIHIDNALNNECIEFSRVLTSFDLQQHVAKSTHTAGHLLDLIITRSDTALNPSVDVLDHAISDHFTVLCELTLEKPSARLRTVNYRSVKRINMDAFLNDLRNGFTNVSDDLADVNDHVSKFNANLKDILDRHAPLKSQVVPSRKSCEWYDDRIRQAKQRRRRAERQWRKSHIKDDYLRCKKEVNDLIASAKSNYYKNMIGQFKDQPKRLFNIMDQLLGNSKARVLPPGRDEGDLAMTFSTFFVEKVDRIRNAIPSGDPPAFEAVEAQCSLESWRHMTDDELRTIIMSSPSKDCSLDPLPTSLLKQCLDPLLPFIRNIINISLGTSTVPSSFKQAIVTPLLKKPNLDPALLANYRPVSNLPFISKILEKSVLNQLNEHLSSNRLLHHLQSAYRSHHSTETSLTRIQNDIIEALNEKRACMLVLLDLTAAFDTVNHSYLLSSLEHDFGVKGHALQWFESYLCERKQSVCVNGHLSPSKVLTSGVPQGSVLGPVLFTLYTSSLAQLLDSHSVQYHFYADDTSIYLSFNPPEIDNAIDSMERCIEDVRSWMAARHLCMNDSKSNFIVIGSKSVLRNISEAPHLKVGNVILSAEECVKSLGVFFDKFISMEDHIAFICKTAFYHLSNIGRIRKFLTPGSCEQLIHAFITSRVDYCNSLFYNLPNRLLKRLQGIQNCAARILTFTKRNEHITPILKQLHWLPVVFRIRYKILLLVFKCLYDLAPVYLSELLTPYVSPRNLRSENQLLLTQPSPQSSCFYRCFRSSGPALWNDLPLHVKSAPTLPVFKSRLKTHLFTQCYF